VIQKLTTSDLQREEWKFSGHTVWESKYHVIWIPNYRKKVMYGELKKYLGKIVRELAIQKESSILEGHLMLDHIRVIISIPPK
jgi:putative transposase